MHSIYDLLLFIIREGVGRRNYTLSSVDEAVVFYNILAELIK